MTRLSTLFSTLLLPLVAAVPLGFNSTLIEHGAFESGAIEPRQRPGSPEHPVLLRIMCLGASITAGVGEPSGNGYRKPLRDKLRWENWHVNYIGSQHSGDATFHNQAHEGHPGAVVQQVHDIINLSISRKPNLILINAGTNDADPGRTQDIGSTGQRMDSMISDLFAQSEGVTIILSTLIPSGLYDYNVVKINDQYRALVEGRQRRGDKIQLAEMHNGFITVDDLRDDPKLTHPNAEGFRKMAAVWYDAISHIQGSISPPIDTGISDTMGDNNCDKKPGGRGPIITQQGSGSEDGPYVHSSVEKGRLYLYQGFFENFDRPTNELHMAQLVNAGGKPRGQEVDEIVRVYDKEFREQWGFPQYSYALATGTGQWSKEFTEFDPGLDCLAGGVQFGDVNNDGLDDFICINAEGNMYVSINKGGNPPTFKPTANGGLIRTGEPWCTQAGVRLGDIDGDGRLDYCCIDGSGDIYCWRNGGQKDAPTEEFDGYWQNMVGGAPTFDHKGQPGIQGVRLVDINGDFRSDWVYVYEDGSTRIFINQRGEAADGGGLKPYWLESTVTHRGFPGEVVTILFGRVFGSNRRDYILVSETAGTFGRLWDFSVWENTGSGGTRLKGDGVYYCDMHNKGYDDYLAVEKDSSVTLYSNIQSPPNWGQDGKIFQFQGNFGLENIHFGDWDGDGFCDVILVTQPDRYTPPVLHRWWRNNHDLTFFPEDPRGLTELSWCKETHGVGHFDQHLHFADVDGDGRVDVLCMQPDGKTFAALNKPTGLMQLGQVKVSEGFDRASHRFADVNGDGRADFIWIDKFTGNADVWYNEGLVTDTAGNLGSAISWRRAGKAYGPMDRGYNMHFPTLGTVGRADFHFVHPRTAQAVTWFNECPNGGGTIEDGDPADPNLPVLPGGTICPRERMCKSFPNKPHFIAMGDSYSAGVNAGSRDEDLANKYDPGHKCYTTDGAYPYDLWSSTANLAQNQFDFISCTGALTKHILTDAQSGRDKTQLQYLDTLPGGSYDLTVLSIGGNDVGFSSVAAQCLIFGTRACQSKIDNAVRLVGETADRDDGLTDRLKQTYRHIASRMSSEGTLIVTGYGRFFNQDSGDFCDGKDLGLYNFEKWFPHHPFGPNKLTYDLRSTINNAIVKLNQKIEQALADVQKEFPLLILRFLDVDPLYDGYRFCDRNPATGELWDWEEVMFFVPYSNDAIDDGSDHPKLVPRDLDLIGTPVDITKVELDYVCEDVDEPEVWDCLMSLTDTDYNTAPIGGLNYPPANTGNYPRVPYDHHHWRKPNIYQTLHPKSFIHGRIRAAIQKNWEGWQQSGECGCFDE